MKRLVLVDGNALLHRAYHATPPLTTPNGELVNAVYGFSLMLLKAWDDLSPDFVAIAWDEKGPTFRHQAYTQYKATRAPSDDGLSSQYNRVFEVTKAFNIPEFRLSGYEADDLIGTLAKQAVKRDKNTEVIILTGDRDIMQVIGERIKVLMPKKTLQDVGLYGVQEFIERFGFEPNQLIEYKALAGDSSDNIPGVQGIGEVTATKLIKQFGSIEKLYQSKNLKTLPERMQKLLSEGGESAVMSKQLATIDCSAPIELDLAKCRVHDFNREDVLKVFQELDFRSLISRLNNQGNASYESGKGAIPAPAGILVTESSDGSRIESGMTKKMSDVGQNGNRQNQDTIDLDLAVEKVLQKMSEHGVLIDLPFLNKLGEDLKNKLKKLEREIYRSVGHEFNLNSPKQLAEILFEELKLEVVRKTKTGRSTDEATLRELYESHPAIPLILQFRQLYKLISTYIDALPKYADERSRVHSTFNVEGAATGRLSSQDPNLQNIPIKDQLGVEIRKAFIAPKGKILMSADYSQIELRIMADVSGDPNLQQAFQEDIDIHALTASKIFKIPVEEVTKYQRMVGKTMNFATLYGQGPRALSQQLGVDFATAKQYIAEYFEEFPKVKEWMAKVLEEGYKKGYVETLWGRRRFIPELQSTNRMFKAAGERAAINHPIQGTQADMIKKAMVEIDRELGDGQTQGGKGCFMILQVHDELLFECDPEDLGSTASLVKDKMEHAVSLKAPVKVEVKTGPNWGEMIPLGV